MYLNRHGDWLYEKQCIAISLKIIIRPMRKYYSKSYIMPHMAYTFPFSLNLKEMRILWIYLTYSPGTYMFWWCVWEEDIEIVIVPKKQNIVNTHVCIM